MAEKKEFYIIIQLNTGFYLQNFSKKLCCLMELDVENFLEMLFYFSLTDTFFQTDLVLVHSTKNRTERQQQKAQFIQERQATKCYKKVPL